jgi:hypothetical protein
MEPSKRHVASTGEGGTRINFEWARFTGVMLKKKICSGEACKVNIRRDGAARDESITKHVGVL